MTTLPHGFRKCHGSRLFGRSQFHGHGLLGSHVKVALIKSRQFVNPFFSSSEGPVLKIGTEVPDFAFS